MKPILFELALGVTSFPLVALLEPLGGHWKLLGLTPLVIALILQHRRHTGDSDG